MKVNYIISLLAICFSLFYTSCDDMDDLHIGFLEEGENIYAAKVDSASVGPGNGRVKMEMLIKAQRIENIRIYWNAYTDSVDFHVGGNVGTFSTIIDNLSEREYLFQIVSFDKFGNRSLPFECTGRACGENYQKTLPNRHIESLEKTEEGEAVFSWSAANSDAEKSVLTYTDAEGTERIREVPVSISKDTIPSFMSESSFTYYTVYRPASNSPDTFDSRTESRSFPE